MMGNDEFDVLVDPYHGYRAFQMAKGSQKDDKNLSLACDS